MLGTEIVTDFAIIMTIAALVVFVFYKLKQPLILGYLIAGIIIGPHTPPFSLISRIDYLGAAADLGVILLLFAIGLEFPLSKLKGIGFKVPLGISAIEIAVMFLISFLAGWILKWSLMDSLFLGTALASSSTAIIAKVLSDSGKLKSTPALVMMGVLIAEDLVVALILAFITSIGGGATTALPGLAWTIGKILFFIFGTLAVGSFLVPKIIDKMDRSDQDEMLILISLGICFGLSVLADLLGLPMAIGAFLAGILAANAVSAPKVREMTHPLKDMFSALFFVSMGALIDISQFRIFIVPALIVTAMMVVGKIVGCTLGTRLLGYDLSTSLKVGLGMAQIGEFAFIVVKAGQDLNLISPVLFPTIGVAVAITAFLTPYLMMLSYKIGPARLLKV